MDDGNEAAGFPCPECNYTRAFILGMTLTGSWLKLMCRACEHVWTVTQ